MRRRSLAFDVGFAALALAVLVLAPFVFPSKALHRFRHSRRGTSALFATSLNLLVGYAGMVSFGHGMFFGLGAYSFGLLMQRTGMPSSRPHLRSTLLITARGTALVIGIEILHQSEIYFAFMTLAFQMLVHGLMILRGLPLTGGDQGLLGGIPRAAYSGIERYNQTHLYITSCVLLVVGAHADGAIISVVGVRLYAGNDPR